MLNGVRSDVDVVSGFSKGSVLGPLLFVINENVITRDIESTSKLFADDCTIYILIRILTILMNCI